MQSYTCLLRNKIHEITQGLLPQKCIYSRTVYELQIVLICSLDLSWNAGYYYRGYPLMRIYAMGGQPLKFGAGPLTIV